MTPDKEAFALLAGKVQCKNCSMLNPWSKTCRAAKTDKYKRSKAFNPSETYYRECKFFSPISPEGTQSKRNALESKIRHYEQVVDKLKKELHTLR